ncbi:MAG: hypothetical protein ACXWCP_28110, partial [Burkholderiales bacterium]
MTGTSSTCRRVLALTLLSLTLGGCASPGDSYASTFADAGQLVQVGVYDRTDGSALPVYAKDGRRYIVGTPGHEYAVRIRNNTAARVLVVTSVDGVNVISGETATPAQSGYVLDPWGSVEIIGWRKSLERTAAFFFTEHESSYAARTGRPNDVGVVGVAVFREKVKPISLRDRELYRGPAASEHDGPAQGNPGRMESRAESPAAAQAPSELNTWQEPARRDSDERAGRTLGKLGTGHGRNENSRVSVVTFERASEIPAETVAI